MSDRSTIVKGANKFGTPINFATEETLQTIAGGVFGLIGAEWDSCTVTYPDTTTEVFTFSFESVEVAEITIVYTDDTKEFVSTINKA